MKINRLHIIIFIEAVLIVIISGLLFFTMTKSTELDSLMPVSENEISKEVPKSSTPASGTFPSDVLDLKNWKITLPIGSSESPIEVKQPVLNKYELRPWFVVNPKGEGVRFRAPVNSVTTSGSNYPRSELREMSADGKEKASWSSSQGIHTMELDQAITAVPKTKRHVVAGQIHDADDDIIVIRLEYPNLYVNVDGDNVVTLDKNYTLGKQFTVKFVAHDGKTDIFYNKSDEPVYTLIKDYMGGYFKAGAYTQSNCSREASSVCTDDNYGEVILYDVSVTHQ